MNMGLAITTIRKEKGFSQKQLNEACKVSQACISQIERGHKRPGEYTLKRIAKVLKVPVILFYIMAIEEKDVLDLWQDQAKYHIDNLINILKR